MQATKPSLVNQRSFLGQFLVCSILYIYAVTVSVMNDFLFIVAEEVTCVCVW